MNYTIKHASAENIEQCALIMLTEYNNNILKEDWTLDCALKLCEFYYKLQPDLFLIAQKEEEVIGFSFSFIKPWAGGNCMMLDEICVKKEYRRCGIAKNLLQNAISTAVDKYSAVLVKAETYGLSYEMPFSWYNRIGFSKELKTFIIEGNPNHIKKFLCN